MIPDGRTKAHPYTNYIASCRDAIFGPGGPLCGVCAHNGSAPAPIILNYDVDVGWTTATVSHLPFEIEAFVLTQPDTVFPLLLYMTCHHCLSVVSPETGTVVLVWKTRMGELVVDGLDRRFTLAFT